MTGPRAGRWLCLQQRIRMVQRSNTAQSLLFRARPLRGVLGCVRHACAGVCQWQQACAARAQHQRHVSLSRMAVRMRPAACPQLRASRSGLRRSHCGLPAAAAACARSSATTTPLGGGLHCSSHSTVGSSRSKPARGAGARVAAGCCPRAWRHWSAGCAGAARSNHVRPHALPCGLARSCAQLRALAVAKAAASGQLAARRLQDGCSACTSATQSTSALDCGATRLVNSWAAGGESPRRVCVDVHVYVSARAAVQAALGLGR